MNPQMDFIKLSSHGQYLELLEKLEEKTAFLVLVQVQGQDPDHDKIVQKANACMQLVERKSVQNWLGTFTLGKPVEQYIYQANREFFEYLRTFESFFLLEPDNLRITDFGYDDIAFLDQDRQPLFFTTTHEGVAYLRRGL